MVGLIIFVLLGTAILIYLGFDSYSQYREHLKQQEAGQTFFTNTSRADGSVPDFFDFVWENKRQLFLSRFERKKPVHEELMAVLMGLDDSALDNLLKLYKDEYGSGAAKYARRTYKKWEKGKVRPQRQTFERFLVYLPKLMSYDLKCEVLRHLMETYGTKDDYKLTVYTDDWETTLEPLVKKIIDKPYNSSLPKQIEDRLLWLADDEMQIAEAILKRSQVEEGRIAVSMLREEFSNIEELLANTIGQRRISHKLKFPYGTINLDIKRR